MKHINNLERVSYMCINGSVYNVIWVWFVL